MISHARQGVAVETSTGHFGPGAVVAGAGERKIHQPIRFELRMHRHVQQSALTHLRHRWQACNGSRLERLAVDPKQATGTFADQHVAVG